MDGYIYFFESVTGWFKVGRTKDWEKRRTAYSGPSAIKTLHFVRKVRNQFASEMMLRSFLKTHGYLQMSLEWYLPNPIWETCPEWNIKISIKLTRSQKRKGYFRKRSVCPICNKNVTTHHMKRHQKSTSCRLMKIGKT